MKICHIVGFIMMVLCGNVIAEIHSFLLKDGRALEAEIMSYNARLGKVELKRPDGKRVKVKPDIFSDKDQSYIKEWASLDDFREESSIRINFSEKIIKRWKDDDNVYEVKHEEIAFEVELENKSLIPFDNIEIKYCIFYEQERSAPGTKTTTNKNVKPGEFKIQKLDAKKKHVLMTEPVEIRAYTFNSTEYYYDSGNPENAYGEIKGVWVRASMTTESGLKAERNFYSSSSIEGNYQWP